MTSFKFFRKLTAAEVGDTKTHEVYIRMPNNFDFELFFNNAHKENGSVIDVDFLATVSSNIDSSIPPKQLSLRFVFFVNSNKEKRIPGLGPIFQTYKVKEGDTICLEKKETNGETSFNLTFLPSDTFQAYNGGSFLFAGEHVSPQPKTHYSSLVPKSLQIIHYGAPGTGKSHKIKDILEQKAVPEENIFRTTFHPDSDYSTFVGTYKPTMEQVTEQLYNKAELINKLTELKAQGITYAPQKFGAKYWRSLKPLTLADKKDILSACGMSDSYTVEFDKGIAVGEDFLKTESRIVYKFTPQTFLNAYIQAYKKPEENIYLIIEEINRGNCAQIFGDLFQLLDRDENGVSEYTIKADTDLRAFLEEKLGKDSAGIKDGELCLPSNLYIYATMNTSDQSLFPIDSAFKRRWDWEYEPIKYENTDWVINIQGNKFSWVSFQKEINKRIFNDTHSEDKMIGDYFVNPKNKEIDDRLLLNKILFYLWNDVCKDGEGDIFKISDTEDVSFSVLYGESGKQKLISMMDYLKVDKIE